MNDRSFETVVMKFGGTSVADAPAIARLCTIVRGTLGRVDVPPVIVVSAMAGVTDRLLALAASACGGDRQPAITGVDELRARHLEAVVALLPLPRVSELVAHIDRDFEELRAMLVALSILREASPRSLDGIASVGELLSSRIVAAALRDMGVSSTWIDARRVIVTDESYTSAAPLLVETRRAVADEIAPHLAAGSAAVVGGFIGATREGVTTTLGRGGSDYSAAIIGAALTGCRMPSGQGRDFDADTFPEAPNIEHQLRCGEIQIWTDVDGMLTADPRVVPQPRVVSRLSFAEASELAYFGAKVLHPSTILPAIAADIPVRILNSRRPDGKGTLITSVSAADSRPIAALACKRAITVVEVTSTRMLMAHGFLRRLFEVFERHRTAVDVVTTSEVSVSVTVDDDRRLDGIVEALREFAEVSVEKEMAILCAVGDNLRADARLAVRLLGALEGFPLRMVSQAASRRNVTVVLQERHLAAAMTRLHEVWLAGESTLAR